MGWCLKRNCFSILYMFFLISGLIFCQFLESRANNRGLDLTALSIEELMDIDATTTYCDGKDYWK